MSAELTLMKFVVIYMYSKVLLMQLLTSLNKSNWKVIIGEPGEKKVLHYDHVGSVKRRMYVTCYVKLISSVELTVYFIAKIKVKLNIYINSQSSIFSKCILQY